MGPGFYDHGYIYYRNYLIFKDTLMIQWGLRWNNHLMFKNSANITVDDDTTLLNLENQYNNGGLQPILFYTRYISQPYMFTQTGGDITFNNRREVLDDVTISRIGGSATAYSLLNVTNEGFFIVKNHQTQIAEEYEIVNWLAIGYIAQPEIES